jgi:hypothetical protein
MLGSSSHLPMTPRSASPLPGHILRTLPIRGSVYPLWIIREITMILPGLKTHEARLHGKGGPRRMSTYLSRGLQLACQPTWALAFNRHPVLLVQSRCLHSSSRHKEMRGLECMHAGKSVYRYPGTVAPAVELSNSGCIKSLLDLLTSVDVFSLSRSRIAWVGASRLGPSCFTQPIVCQRIRGGIPVASCTTVTRLGKGSPTTPAPRT